MRDPAEIKATIAEANPEALFADGFEEALIGMAYRCGKPALAAYSVQKCLAILQERDGMDYDGALEFLEFNSIGAWAGDNTPVWIYD